MSAATDLLSACSAAYAAAYGDSNDDEIERLTEALDEALAMLAGYGVQVLRRDDYFSGGEDEAVEND